MTPLVVPRAVSLYSCASNVARVSRAREQNNLSFAAFVWPPLPPFASSIFPSALFLPSVSSGGERAVFSSLFFLFSIVIIRVMLD